MSSQLAHDQAVARHLRAFDGTIDQFPDWAAVILFYAALHTLEAAFSLYSVHHNGHGDRGDYIKKSHNTVWPSYHRLQNESMKARYLQGGAFCMSSAAVKAELRGRHFENVKKYAERCVAAKIPEVKAPATAAVDPSAAPSETT